MPEKPRLDDAAAVHKHLDILQGVIDRMAAESRMLKTWCITIVAAILILVARGDIPPFAVAIAFVPTLAFAMQDWWYLKMERGFRNSYNDFVGKLHAGELPPDALYVVKPKGLDSWKIAWVPFPRSVLVFYPIVALAIILVCVLMYAFPPMAEATIITPPEKTAD